MPYSSTPRNTNEGSGKIPYRRRKPHKSKPKKKHKSQPHARTQPSPTSKLDQPLYPGGITTVRQFRQERKAAITNEFAPQEEAIQQEQKAIPAWYQDYLRKLQGLQTQTTQQFEGLQSQAGSLAETAADATPEGQKAMESRNQIVAAIQGALLQQQGAAGNSLTQMGGVAGLRNEQRLGEVSSAKSKLAKAKGDFSTEYTSKARQTEFENALAAKQFGLKVQEQKDKPKPETTYEKNFAKQAAEHGYTPHQWALLGPKGRAKRIQEKDARSGNQPKTLKRIEKEETIKIAAKYGYDYDDWVALPARTRSSLIRGAQPKPKKPQDPRLTPGQQETGGKTATRTGLGATALLNKGKSRYQAGEALKKLDDAPPEILINAALDAAYEKHLSRETARRLQKAGYKASEIAKALGVPTFTEYRRRGRVKPKTRKVINPFD